MTPLLSSRYYGIMCRRKTEGWAFREKRKENKMNGKIEEFVKDVKEQLGAACVGVIDKSKEEGQIGFATTEPDQGENVPGKYNELFEKTIAKHGLERCVHMPFPVSGRLVYTVAGLKRYA